MRWKVVLLTCLLSMSGYLTSYLSASAAEIGPVDKIEAYDKPAPEVYSVIAGVTYITMKESIAIYVGAGQGYDTIGSLQKGQMALSTGRTDNNWMQIYYIGKIGYVPKDSVVAYTGNTDPLPEWKVDFTSGNIRINVLGDSITYGDKLTSASKSYCSLLKGKEGVSAVNNYGFNGSAVGGTHPDRFVDRYQTMDLNADLILVSGGTNDYGCLGDEYGTELGKMGDVSDATFYGALNQLMCGLKQMYPEGEIVFMTPLGRSKPNRKNEFGYVLSDYVSAVNQMSAFYGIRVIDLNAAGELDFAGDKSGYLVDGLHPNSKGHALLADYIYGQLLNID